MSEATEALTRLIDARNAARLRVLKLRGRAMILHEELFAANIEQTRAENDLAIFINLAEQAWADEENNLAPMDELHKCLHQDCYRMTKYRFCLLHEQFAHNPQLN